MKQIIIILLMCIICLFSVNAISYNDEDNIFIDFNKYNINSKHKYLIDFIRPIDNTTSHDYNIDISKILVSSDTHYLHINNNYDNNNIFTLFNFSILNNLTEYEILTQIRFNNITYPSQTGFIFASGTFKNNFDTYPDQYALLFCDTDLNKFRISFLSINNDYVINNDVNCFVGEVYNVYIETRYNHTDLNFGLDTLYYIYVWNMSQNMPNTYNYKVSGLVFNNQLFCKHDTNPDCAPIKKSGIGFKTNLNSIDISMLYITSTNENLYLNENLFPIYYTKEEIDALLSGDITETEVLKFGQCPSTTGGIRNLWIITIILLVLGITFIIINKSGYSVGIGLIMSIVSLSFYQCGDILNYILILIGLSYVLIGLFKKD